MEQFSEANRKNPVVLSFANHDFRDIKKDILKVYKMLKKSKKKYKNVKFSYCNGVDAMRKALDIKKGSKFKIN